MKYGSTILLLAACAAVTAHADPYPHRKPGLWELSLSQSGSRVPPMTSKYCIDAATESALISTGQTGAKNMCSQANVHVSGAQITADMVCKFGTSTQTSHTITTFTGNSAYHSVTQSHLQPAMFGVADRTMTIDARWTGPCPKDMKPGDVVMANGIRTNISPPAH